MLGINGSPCPPHGYDYTIALVATSTGDHGDGTAYGATTRPRYSRVGNGYPRAPFTTDSGGVRPTSGATTVTVRNATTTAVTNAPKVVKGRQ